MIRIGYLRPKDIIEASKDKYYSDLTIDDFNIDVESLTTCHRIIFVTDHMLDVQQRGVRIR